MQNETLKQKILTLLESMHTLAIEHKNIYNDYTKESDFLKYAIRDEFNSLSDELFKLFSILYDNFNIRLSIYKKVLRYNEIDFVITCDKEMLDFMDDDFADAIIKINLDLMKSSQHSEIDNNLESIKRFLNHSSDKLSTAALLCMQNYPKELYSEISYDRFTNSNDPYIQDLIKKIKTESNRCTLYDKMTYLHKIPMFSLITYDQLYNLALSTKIESFKAGVEIIKQGENADTLYILTSGEVKVIIDNKEITTLEDGDFFGEIAIMADTSRTATVKTTLECITLKLSRQIFKELIYDNPKIGIDVMKEITNRLLYNSHIG